MGRMKISVFVLSGWLLALACASNVADEPAPNFVQKGKASYYANSLAGNFTASGERYHPDSLTAASAPAFWHPGTGNQPDQSTAGDRHD